VGGFKINPSNRYLQLQVTFGCLEELGRVSRLTTSHLLTLVAKCNLFGPVKSSGVQRVKLVPFFPNKLMVRV